MCHTMTQVHISVVPVRKGPLRPYPDSTEDVSASDSSLHARPTGDLWHHVHRQRLAAHAQRGGEGGEARVFNDIVHRTL